MNCGQLLDGKYRILRVLGQGGMGRVYLAENVKLGTLWAIKEIYKQPGSGESIPVEPNILKKLRHPALPRIFDIIEEEDRVYIVVDFIDGVSLDKMLERERRFPEKTVLEWGIQLCDVLSYLHNHKPNPIIYRDMKPSNIILAADGSIKLIDFGIAREYNPESDTDTVYIGTRGYAAPEQYGAGQTGVTSDIYSLGVTLYHLLTGKSPNEPPYEIKPVRYFVPELSEKIERIILKCTRADPSERYQSAAELMEDMNALYEEKWKEKVNSSENEYTFPCFNAIGNASGFKRLVLTIWDNAEFGCELAYTAAKLSGYKVLLIDFDLLSPKADLVLKVDKLPERIVTGGGVNASGLSVVMDSIEKNSFTPELLEEASVTRRELKNLYILTGNYKLDSYEYYSDDGLVKLIDKAYQCFDITVLLVNRSIYDSYTVISLIKSDFNIAAIRADIAELREFNRYLTFLHETQKIPLSKTKFVAFEYKPNVNLNKTFLNEVTGHNFAGHISYSKRREVYRNLKLPYARRMDKDVLADYTALLAKFNILPKRTLAEVIKSRLIDSVAGIKSLIKAAVKKTVKVMKRRQDVNAGNQYTP